MSTELYVEISSRRYITREASDPDDSYDRDSTYTEQWIESISVKNNQSFDEMVISLEDIKPDDVVYLVWGHWGSGDSFGSDNGAYAELFLITKDYDFAKEVEDAIEKSSDNSRITVRGENFYVPWHGYFDILEGVYIYSTSVQG